MHILDFGQIFFILTSDISLLEEVKWHNGAIENLFTNAAD